MKFTAACSSSLSRAEEAIEDFRCLLSVSGKRALDSKDFASILDAVGFQGKSEEVFEALVCMCRSAASLGGVKNPNLSVGEIDAEAMACLYKYHPSYATCNGKPMKTAEALTGYLKGVVSKVASSDTASSSGDDTADAVLHGSTCGENEGSLSRKDSSLVLNELMNDVDYDAEPSESTMTDEDIEVAVEELWNQSRSDDPQNHLVDLESLSSALLRYDSVSSSVNECFGGTLPNVIFDPMHVNADNFLNVLEQATFSHDALNHHFLSSVSKGSFGGFPGTVDVISNYMVAYGCFTKHFCHFLKETTDMISKSNPAFGEILEENMEEEKGIYDDETKKMIHDNGLVIEELRGIHHRDLYHMCSERLQDASKTLNLTPTTLTLEEVQYISEPLVEAFEEACLPAAGATPKTAIAAMYLGSELIVSQLYSKLSAFLRINAEKTEFEAPLTRQDLAFFLLHMDMDVAHAENMRDIVVAHAKDRSSRYEMVEAANAILSARVEFYDRFLETMFPPTGHGGENSASLYNKQSTNWVRKSATCLSDFTGRPVVFDVCAPFVSEAHVLDVGCGEGYVARKLVEMGANRVVGLDVSPEMVERARKNPERSGKEYYATCDASDICKALRERAAEFGVLPGRMTTEGCFDLAVAVFLFNYTRYVHSV